MDTYLEPIDDADMMNRSNTNPVVEDLSVTEIISGGTLSEGKLLMSSFRINSHQRPLNRF